MFEKRLLEAEIGPISSITRLIRGEGDFSKVYEATDRFGHMVALKVIKRDAIEGVDETYFEGLLQLSHENICRVIFAGPLADGRIYYVLEYVDGGSLERLLQNQPHLSESKIVRISLEVLRGLRHLESNSVIHGDIKPGNILLTKAEKPKISDFGLALNPTLATPGQGCGYGSHRSPELAAASLAGRAYIKTIASDIYAFGMTLYRMVIGDVGFRRQVATSGAQLAQDIATGRFPDREQFPATFSEPLLRVIKTCLERNPRKRYTSFSDVAKALNRVKCEVDWSEMAAGEYSGVHNKKRLEYLVRLRLVACDENNSAYLVDLLRRKCGRRNWMHVRPPASSLRSPLRIGQLRRLLAKIH